MSSAFQQVDKIAALGKRVQEAKHMAAVLKAALTEDQHSTISLSCSQVMIREIDNLVDIQTDYEFQLKAAVQKLAQIASTTPTKAPDQTLR
jgi:hypothetical protein